MPTSSSDPWLRKVQALLAKAASTDFSAEADALVAKAQELMTRHAIDEAMLRTAGSITDRRTVGSRTITVPGPYATAKASLLAVVAEANSCRCVHTGSAAGTVTCVLVGFETDLDKSATLFAALSLHATRTMLAAPVPSHDSPRRFRHAFMLAFASRVGERLRHAAESVRAAASSAGTAGGGSVALVLAERDRSVDRAFADRFPHIRRMRTSASSAAGLASGRSAADRAALGGDALRAPRGLAG